MWKGGIVTPVNTCTITLTVITQRAVRGVTVETEPGNVIGSMAGVLVKKMWMYVFSLLRIMKGK